MENEIYRHNGPIHDLFTGGKQASEDLVGKFGLVPGIYIQPPLLPITLNFFCIQKPGV